jgi:hypothetical protein
MRNATDARGRQVTDRDANVAKDARDGDVFVAGGTRLGSMPRIPRFGRGEQDAPTEAHAAEQQAQPEQTQQLTSGDPLATPAPAPAAQPAAPTTHDLTSGDPLSGAAPQSAPTPAVPSDPTPAPLSDDPSPAAPADPPPPAPADAAAPPAPVEELGGSMPAAAEPLGDVTPDAPAEAGAAETGAAEAGATEAGATEAAPGPQPTVADAPLWSATDAPDAGEPPTAVAPPPAPAVFPAEAAGVAGVTAGAAAAAATSETAQVGAVAAEGEAPATVEESPADARPSFRERTRMRRRMRELRRLREIAFRDLGGLTFDLHRFGRDRQDLVAEKLQSLERIDGELRALETALDARRPLIELREPGIAACPRCATLHGTDANFCPGCGTPLRGSVVSEAGPLRVTPVEHQDPQQPAAPS